MSGKAIDGYIQGATAFLDINANGILDKGEPSDTTDEQGQYDFNLSNEQAECQQYAATVIDVPIGAIDSDYPDNPITEPYQLTYPPSIATTSDSDILAVTPLSTIVWVGIQRDLTAEDKSPTCTALLHNEELRGDIINRVEEQELRVAYRYNITVDELYSDYVETNNEELHLLAQNLVPGLQKSYDETSDISKKATTMHTLSISLQALIGQRMLTRTQKQQRGTASSLFNLKKETGKKRHGCIRMI